MQQLTVVALFVFFISSLEASETADTPNVERIAWQIDHRLREIWNREEVTPASQCSDEQFLRRVSLDMLGRVPTIAEVRGFRADSDDDKRSRLIARYMDLPLYQSHMARNLRRSWFPQTDAGRATFLAEDTEMWIAGQLRTGVGYDQIVRQLITVGYRSGQRNVHDSVDAPVPPTFLLSNEHKPERMASNATRTFLGVNLDCAQCHDHPFGRWSQDQFWETAAFFVQVNRDAQGRNSLAVPESSRTVYAAFLTKPNIEWPRDADSDSGRRLFAHWLTDDRNPYFAKNAVNCLWAQVFGVALVEPADDISASGDAVFSDLLDDLARAFVQSGYDWSLIHKAVLNTHAYQTITCTGEASPQRAELFAEHRTRALTGKQLYDSLLIATGHRPFQKSTATLEQTRLRGKFLEMFQLQRERPNDRSIVQSLAQMNGEVTAVAIGESPLVVSVADAPFLSDQECISALFLATLGRDPSVLERTRCVAYLQSQTKAEALEDILWALVNSVEFNTNH